MTVEITREKASASTNGRGVKVAATSTPGTAVHVVTSDADHLDHVTLWARNTDTALVTLSVEWGGVTDPDDLQVFPLPPDDRWYLLGPGFSFDGGVTIAAFASVADKVVVMAEVNRIDNSL